MSRYTHIPLYITHAHTMRALSLIRVQMGMVGGHATGNIILPTEVCGVWCGWLQDLGYVLDGLSLIQVSCATPS